MLFKFLKISFVPLHITYIKANICASLYDSRFQCDCVVICGNMYCFIHKLAVYIYS